VKWYIAMGWLLLAGSLIGWPLSAFTFAKDEPPTVLHLSWLAITLNALGIIVTAYVKRDTSDKERPP